jgi:hypothetical protein
MGYYMGDYYGGGSYYRGDPFWGFVGRAIKGVARLATGLGGGKALTAAPAAAGRASIIPKMLGAGGAIVATGGAAIGRMVAKHPVLSAAGAAAVLGTGLGAGGEALMGAPGAAAHGMHGYHIERKGKHAGQWIKNRHMRVTNPKALRRAIRRTHGFARLAMKTIHLVHPKKKARFGGFRRRRAKK